MNIVITVVTDLQLYLEDYCQNSTGADCVIHSFKNMSVFSWLYHGFAHIADIFFCLTFFEFSSSVTDLQPWPS